jgi:two-component system response regulator YesN
MENENIFRVIVAEDEELILNNTVKKIHQTGFGFEVIAAVQNGKLALDKIEESSPDVLITDIRMPVMDGLELIKNVALNYPYIKTIIISGFSEFEYAKQAMKYGVKDYLLKPLESEELKAALIGIKISLEADADFLQRQIQKDEDRDYSPEEIVSFIELFMKENFSQEINLNASYLSKIYKKYREETPLKYLLNLRINRAKHLLLNNPELEIKTVGELVGYPDQFYFSRIFKHLTGKSPTEFRDGK